MKIKVPHLALFLMASSLISFGFSNLKAVGQTGQVKNRGILYQSETYFCDEDAVHPTLVFRSDLGNARLVEFQYSGFGEKWQPLERCRELARRFSEFHGLGIISYLTDEVLEDGTKVICISSIDADHLQLLEINPNFVRLLITLKPEDDPKKVLDEIRGISSLSSNGEPIIQ
ncbi:MAG: COP23 domain-containing protein [Leptolyngbyaceae cyanobacterium MO_188.B28]|nr:COP23 domain-containing protein [Leptolyngbyaceae cyanobacterium MO_188.B28]